MACYSATSAPYGSFASVSTPVVKHRDEMAAGRGFGSTAGGIIVTFILPLVMYTTVKDSTGADKKILNGPVLIWVAIIFAILLWVCYQITLKGTVERIRVDKKEKADRVPLLKSLKYMFSNRAMVALMLAALLLIFAQMFAGAVNSYLYKDYFENTGALAILAVQNVPVLIVAPFVPAICDKYGKKLVCGVLLIFTCVVYVVMFFMHITNPYVFVVMSIVAIFGNGVFGLMVWSFITDIIDDIQVKTHTREDGTVYTGYMFARKIGQALSGLLPAVVLAATGYVTATSGEAVRQSVETLNNNFLLVKSMHHTVVRIVKMNIVADDRVAIKIVMLLQHQRSPCAEVGPSEVGWAHEDLLRLLHNGVVDRDILALGIALVNHLALSRCAVDCIEVTILLLELVYLVVDIFQYFQRELTVLTDRFAIVKLLQLIQCGDTKGSCHRFQKFADLFVRFQMSAIETALTVCQWVRGCTHLTQVFIRTDMQVTDHL